MIANQNLQGSLWMVFAMALFAIEDALLKALIDTLPIGLALFLFGFAGMLTFVAWGTFTQQAFAKKAMLSRLMLIRFVFEVTGRLFYFLAVAFTSLSAATVVLQATPILVVAAAALLLKENVGPRRWIAVAVGFIGVLVVLRPGTSSFDALSILAVIGLIGFAGRDLASRMAPSSFGMIGLGFTGFTALTVAGLTYAVWMGEHWRFLSTEEIGLIAPIIPIGIVAYLSLMKAMRTGDVSAVTPFRYTRLIFGVVLGFIVFGETMDFATWIGSALIVASGLFILWRGHLVTKA